MTGADVLLWPKADMPVRDSDVRFRAVNRTWPTLQVTSANDEVDDARSGIGVP